MKEVMILVIHLKIQKVESEFTKIIDFDYRNYIVKIKLLFIKNYSSSAVEKRIPIKDFLSQFQRSNQKIAKI